jgi:hypothetical protein
MESESQTLALAGNWLFFFIFVGGTIFFGVRFSKLALNNGYNRYLFGAIGVVLYITLIMGYTSVMRSVFPEESLKLSFSIIAAAIATTVIVYVVLKKLWEKSKTT